MTIKKKFYDNKNDNRFKIGFIETKIGLPKKTILTTLTKMCRSTKESVYSIKTVSKFGTLTPMIQIAKIYFGAHGN